MMNRNSVLRLRNYFECLRNAADIHNLSYAVYVDVKLSAYCDALQDCNVINVKTSFEIMSISSKLVDKVREVTP